MDHPHAYALRLAGTAGSFKGQGPVKARYTGLNLSFFEQFCPFGTSRRLPF